MDKPALNPESFNGPLYIGSIVASCLFACFVLQTSRYFAHEKKDTWQITSLVIFVLTMELSGVVGMIHAIYGVLCITSVGPSPTFTFPISGAITPIFSAFTTISTQLFFAWRINALARAQNTRWPVGISGIICVLALAQLGGYITITVQGRLYAGDAKKFAYARHPMLLRLSSTVVCDVLMSGTLISLLWPHRHSIRRSSRNVVNSIIRSTIENGSITAFAAMVQLIFYLTRQKDLIHIGFAYVTARLHANVLIGSLNARRRLRELDDAVTTFTVTGGTNPAIRRGTTNAHRIDRLFHNPLGVAAGATTTTTNTNMTSSGRRHSLSVFNRTGRSGRDTDEMGSIHLTTSVVKLSLERGCGEGEGKGGKESKNASAVSVKTERMEEADEEGVERNVERKGDLERGL